MPKRVVVDFQVPKKTLILAFINIFFYFFGFFSVKAMLPLIIDDRLRVSSYIILFIFSLRYISCAVYDSFISDITKKLSLRVSISVGIISLLVVFLGLYNAAEIFPFMILFIVLGISSGINELTFLNKSQSLGIKGIQTYYGAFFAGTFFAFFLSGFILELTSVNVLFIISSIALLIPLIIILITSRPHELKKVKLISILSHKNFVKIEIDVFSRLKDNMVFMFLVKLVAEGFNSMKEVLVPLIVINSLNGSTFEVSLVLGLTILPTLLIERNLDFILKHMPPIFLLPGPKRRVLGLSLFLMAASSILIIFAKNTLFLGILIAIAMIAFSMINPVLNLFILKFHNEDYEKENALLHISSQVGKWAVLVFAAIFTYFFDNLALVFVIPGVIFFLLFLFFSYDCIFSRKLWVQKDELNKNKKSRKC